MYAFHSVAGFSQPASVYCVFITYIRYNRQMGRKEKRKQAETQILWKNGVFHFVPVSCGFILVTVSWADNAAIVVVAAVSWPMGAVLCALMKVSALCFA